MRRLERIFLAVTVMGLASGAGCSAGGEAPLIDPDGSTPSDGATSCRGQVTGQVRFPNGLMTVPSALVYLTAPGREVARSGECGQCLGAEGVAASTSTAVDGTFLLDYVPPGDYDLVIEKGLFERRQPVTVGCDEVALAPRDVALPGAADQGRIPRIAVIRGAHDFMEGVLVKLGLGEMSSDGRITQRSFDVFDGPDALPDPSGGGTADETRALLRDPEMLHSYDYLFVNCGSGLEGYVDDIGGMDPSPVPPGGGGFPEPEEPVRILEESTVRDNLRAFVERGGRLYVTDQAYDFIEQVYPAALDYMGGTGDGLGAEPEQLNEAENGDDLPLLHAQVHDEQLTSWLRLHGMLEDEGTVPIRHLVGGWAGVAAAGDNVTTWVSGSIGATPSAPLTLTFGAGCGRVLFTSYHTRPMDGAHSPALNAQEMILGYLAFEIGNCVDDPVLI